MRDEVLANTGRRQEPFVYGSLGGTAVELVPAPKPAPVVAAPPADQDAAVRRDYEFAERIGTKEAWDSFLSSYSTGLYARLAQAQRNKLVAEENRVAATEKAKAAEQAQRAAEGAKVAEQAKARAQAKAAEQARQAAELAKKAEEDKLAEIQRARLPVRATTPTGRDVAVTSKVEEGPAADGTAVADKPVGPVAALTTATPPDAEKPAAAQVPRLLLTELRRVGCHTASIDDSWNANARRSLERYNKQSRRQLDTNLASLEALDAVKRETARVCPLQCGVREVERNGSCVAKVCSSGLVLDADGDCVKKGRAALAARPQKPSGSAEKKPPQTTTSQKASGAVGSCGGGYQACMQRMIAVGWKSWEAAQTCERRC